MSLPEIPVHLREQIEQICVENEALCADVFKGVRIEFWTASCLGSPISWDDATWLQTATKIAIEKSTKPIETRYPIRNSEDQRLHDEQLSQEFFLQSEAQRAERIATYKNSGSK